MCGFGFGFGGGEISVFLGRANEGNALPPFDTPPLSKVGGGEGRDSRRKFGRLTVQRRRRRAGDPLSVRSCRKKGEGISIFRWLLMFLDGENVSSSAGRRGGKFDREVAIEDKIRISTPL